MTEVISNYENGIDQKLYLRRFKSKIKGSFFVVIFFTYQFQDFCSTTSSIYRCLDKLNVRL